MTAAVPPPSAASAADSFPHAWTEEADLPAYLRVRAEGLPLYRAIWSGLSYLRKYRRAKWSAPPEELRYFDEQRRLLRWLGRDNPGTGVRLAAVGDIMWLRDGWNSFLSPEVLAYLNGHEFVLGNLETPISSRFRAPSFLPDYFTYNSDPDLIQSFRRPDGTSTFSALTTANNHCLDRGDAGLTDTLEFLDAQKIPHVGVRRKPGDRSFLVLEVGGLRVGLYAACWGLNNPESVRRSALGIEVFPGLAPRVHYPVDVGRVRAALDGMTAAGCDFRIVYLHWGHEFEFYPCPWIMRVGRDIVQAGADLLLGSHPHVLQPVEVCFFNGYEERYLHQGADLPALTARSGCVLADGTGVPRKAMIAYSLGNFATAMFTLHCRIGMVLSLGLMRDPETGRVDWHHPDVQFVYNVACDPRTNRRRLALLETFLRERERAGDRAGPLRDMAGWLERHLLGERA